MGLVGAAGPSAMAKLKGAMAKLSATPGDPKTDVLVVIASRLIMNDGNGITRETRRKAPLVQKRSFPVTTTHPPVPHRIPAADVIAATQVPPANDWIATAFDGKKINPDMVKTALSQAKQHFKVTNGFYEMIGWPLPRRVECGVSAEFDPDPRLGRDLVDDVVAWREEKPAGGRGRGKHHRGDTNDEHEDRVSKMGGDKKRRKTAPAESRKPGPKAKAKAKASKPSEPKAARAPTPAPQSESESEEEILDVDPGNITSKIKFIGAPRKGGVYRNRTYYDGFETIINKAGKIHRLVYNTGDCVYAMPGDPSEDMYLAQIDSVFADDSGQYVDCVWLERAGDVKNMVDGGTWKEMKCAPNEVFLCTTVNANPIQSIEGKATILTPEEFKAADHKKHEKDGENVFVCRRALVVKASKKKGAKKGNNMSFPEVRKVSGKGFQVVGQGPKKPKGR